MGKFFLVGGGPAARTMGEQFMNRFVAEAGGSEAKLTIITAGTNDPEEVNACYWEIFSALGMKNLFSPKIVCREDAQADWVYHRIAETNAVFIAGGAQDKLAERLSGTGVEAGFRAVLARGGIVGGTSAGASIFGGPMILDGGTSNKHLRPDMVDIGMGFDMLGANIAVDTHCSSRGRIPRLVSLLIDQPALHVIGIDEDTVLLVDEDGSAEVLGYNAVYLLDAANSRAAHGHNNSDRSHLCRADIMLHCLTRGDRYHIWQRRPI
jgi:cyanophycinase